MENATLTLREAAFAFGDKLKNIVKIVEEHNVSSRKIISGNRKLRVLGMSDLMYLQLLGEVGELLTPKGRLEWHQALLKNRDESTVSVGRLSLSFDELQKSVEKRLEALKALKDTVEGNPEDPYLKGTHIEVYRISAILEAGATPEDVLHDYPSLTLEQIDQTMAYASAIPKKGRPYPGKSFKSAIKGLNLDLLDELDEATE